MEPRASNAILPGLIGERDTDSGCVAEKVGVAMDWEGTCEGSGVEGGSVGDGLSTPAVSVGCRIWLLGLSPVGVNDGLTFSQAVSRKHMKIKQVENERIKGLFLGVGTLALTFSSKVYFCIIISCLWAHTSVATHIFYSTPR